MSKRPKYPDPLPFWFTNMSSDGVLLTKDIILLFGFKNSNSVTSEICEGQFPKSDYCEYVRRGRHTPKTHRWKKSTILKEIERRKSLAKVGQ